MRTVIEAKLLYPGAARALWRCACARGTPEGVHAARRWKCCLGPDEGEPHSARPAMKDKPFQ
jgi:hypothetical protein